MKINNFNSMKKALIVVLIILVGLAAGYVYFSKDKVIFSKETTLYKAIPESVPVFVELSSMDVIEEDNEMVKQLCQIKDIERLFDVITKIKAAVKKSNTISSQLLKRPVVLAIDFVGDDELSPVIIYHIKNSSELAGFEELVSSLTGVNVASFSTRKYSGHKITDVVLSDGKSLHFSVVDGLVMLSPESILIEKCIRQLGVKGIMENQYFRRVNKSVTSQSKVSWYINHSKFPNLCQKFLNGKSSTVVNEFGEEVRKNYRKNILATKEYASWSELDMKFYEDRIAVNGISSADDSLNHYLSVFEGQQAASFKVENILPSNTSYFYAVSLSDKNRFLDKLEMYYGRTESFYKREEMLKKMGRGLRVNMKNTFSNVLKNGIVGAITNISEDGEDPSSFFIMNVQSVSDARVALDEMVEGYAKTKKIEKSALISSHKTNIGASYQLYEFPYHSFPSVFLGKSFGFVKARNVVLYKDNLVFASTKKVLIRYLNDMEAENFLKESPSFRQFDETTESKSNITVYLDINRAYSFGKQVLDKKLQKGLETNEETFRKFGVVGWQLVCEQDIFFNNINICLKKKSEEPEANAIWEYPVGGNVINKPQIVINHRNQAEKEIIFQDSNNKLHLVNADGKKVWSAPIKGKIMGEIHQIDYYRNGRLQYLFNTSEKLYLVDRNGRNVANFPVFFKAPATNGVNVFDYDNNRKYRYFVACEDHKVYALSHEGAIIKGWEFGKTKSNVTTPVQHFRVANKDYIVFKDKSKIYVQNRRGATRVSHAISFENSKNKLELSTKGKPKIVATDASGKVYYLYFDGKFEEKKTSRFTNQHFFNIGEINGDGVLDYLFTDGKELKVIDEAGRKLFTEKFDGAIKFKPNIYSFSGGKKVGVTDADSDEIYLINADGEVQKGFPLKGNSEFTIGALRAGQLSLIVGTSDGELRNYLLD